MKGLENTQDLNGGWFFKGDSDGSLLNGGEHDESTFFDSLFEETQKIAAVTNGENKADIVIKLWKNGFTVNDEEIRSYTDVANQQFLESVRKGATPRITTEAQNGLKNAEKETDIPSVLLNDLEPITCIQIWLADGRKLVQKFNLSHKISHIRAFVENIQGATHGTFFTLATSFPYRELRDETLNIQEADLHNAVIVQRLSKIDTVRSS
ncbi:UBX domain-containing protein 2A isoform X2 [Latimeria chalumnae]|uniref:UBX domain-containing protein 2A isoform X2 n=1 Tax=Latimeria chalumnae TaxID=7897 RepID=UPI0003C16877|nr:PREDICTED: UBX domain-containing protein 2A isoform X2 [Latimeria chalumnae]|eukprot:XP_006013082.1 PREDICTED: UBX domain-containing protein 2A isoform X2 [Latimeria chalumnae]